MTLLHPAAHDRRHPEHRQDLPEALAVCAAFIGRHLRGEVAEQAMHEAVSRFSADMHSAGVPPERALAQLKSTVLQVPEVVTRPAMERAELLRALVEAAIRGYYASPNAPM